MFTTLCPHCSSQVTLDDTAQNRSQVECPHCRAEFPASTSLPVTELREPELDEEDLAPDFDQTSPWTSASQAYVRGKPDLITPRSSIELPWPLSFAAGLFAGILAAGGVAGYLWRPAPAKVQPAAQESPSFDPQTPIASEVAAEPEPEAEAPPKFSLKEVGAMGFPQSEATVLRDDQELRVSIWNDDEHLYVQAVIWNDNQDGGSVVGKDGTNLHDHSSLILDFGPKPQGTPRNRRYWLTAAPQMPGLRYAVSSDAAKTVWKSDSKGAATMQYLDRGDGQSVRVDSFVIPLAEIGQRPGDNFRLAFHACSAIPRLEMNSAGIADAAWPPLDKYHEVSLEDRSPGFLGAVLASDGRVRAVSSEKNPLPPLTPAAGFGTEFLVTAGTEPREIYRYNLAAREWKNLTAHVADDINPAWSPDGSKIAFLSNRNGANRLFVMDADGTNVTQITDHDCAAGSSATWSPSGDKIAVSSPGARPPEAWTIGLDGTNRTPLSARAMWDFSWSPAGDRFAFAINTEAGFSVGTLDATGGQIFQELSMPNPYGFVEPNWSPDGKEIAFVAWRERHFRVCVMNADGGNLRELTTTGNCYGPTFSRDGRSVLYQERTDYKSAGRLFVVDAGGGSPQEFAWPVGLDYIHRAPFVWRPDKSAR